MQAFVSTDCPQTYISKHSEKTTKISIAIGETHAV